MYDHIKSLHRNLVFSWTGDLWLRGFSLRIRFSVRLSLFLLTNWRFLRAQLSLSLITLTKWVFRLHSCSLLYLTNSLLLWAQLSSLYSELKISVGTVCHILSERIVHHIYRGRVRDRIRYETHSALWRNSYYSFAVNTEKANYAVPSEIWLLRCPGPNRLPAWNTSHPEWRFRDSCLQSNV
jgi:hypothetical protein